MFRTKVPPHLTVQVEPLQKGGLISAQFLKGWGGRIGEGPDSAIFICWFEAIVGFALETVGKLFLYKPQAVPIQLEPRIGAAPYPAPNSTS